jgi:hypothetical protein
MSKSPFRIPRRRSSLKVCRPGAGALLGLKIKGGSGKLTKRGLMKAIRKRTVKEER